MRLEIGPLDIQKNQTLSVRRDTGVKAPISLTDLDTAVPTLLETIQKEMFERAKKTYLERMKVVTEWDDVVPTLDNKNIVVIPWCEAEACEDDIKERTYGLTHPDGSETTWTFLRPVAFMDNLSNDFMGKVFGVMWKQNG